MKFSFNFLLISFILFLGIFLRFYQLGTIPSSLYWDELAIGNDAYAISQTGKDINGNNWLQAIYPSYGDYKAPVAIWLTALSFKAFGMSEWSLRLPFLLSSLILWLSLSLLTREFMKSLSPKLDQIWIWLVSIMILYIPWSFHFARIGFESGMSLGFLSLSILLIYYGLIKDKFTNYYIFTGITLSIVSTYTYFSIKYIFPIMFVSILVAFGKQFFVKKVPILLGLFLYLFSLVFILKSPFYHSSQQYRLTTSNIINTMHYLEQSNKYIEKYGRNIFTRAIFHRYLFLTKDFAQNYIKYFSPKFLFIKGDNNLRHNSGYGGELLPIFAPFLLIGLYYGIFNFRKRVVWLTLFWLLFTPAIAAIPNENYHASRSIYMLIPLGLILGFSLIQISQWLNKKYTKLFIYFSIFLLFVNFSAYAYDYFYKYPTRSLNAWQSGNTKQAKLIKNLDKQHDVWLTDKFWMPVNAVLFYNPHYILDIQQKTIDKKLYNTFWWVKGFANIHFGFPQKEKLNKGDIIISDQPHQSDFQTLTQYSIGNKSWLYKLKLGRK